MKFTREDYTRRIVDIENKIPGDEPVFLLRAQDIHAPDTMRFYSDLLRAAGNIDMAEELRQHAADMIVWQKSVRVKSPDKPGD